MVKKLYRHEFVALFRIILPIAALCLVLSAFFGCTLAVQDDLPEQLEDVGTVMMGLLTFVYVISIIVMTAATYFIVIARFYKHLLSNEGYLTFSLPVSTTTHLVCKLICGCIASVFSLFAAFLSINVAMLCAGVDYVEAFKELAEIDLSVIPSNLIPKIIGIGVLMLVCMVVSLFMGILLPYVSMCIGQLAKKNKLAMSFLWYFIISNVANLINNILSTVMTFTIIENMSYYEGATAEENVSLMLDSYSLSLVQITLVATVLSIVYFLVARYILNNKLNLE